MERYIHNANACENAPLHPLLDHKGCELSLYIYIIYLYIWVQICRASIFYEFYPTYVKPPKNLYIILDKFAGPQKSKFGLNGVMYVTYNLYIG